ncbi:MAG: phosphoribosylglycinamide formyltransferase [bacterium]|nr:phosphoribosylglycinamide formyltransferase [bacterium]
MENNLNPLRIAVFASGTGTNFQAIFHAIKEKRLDAVIAGIITNNPGSAAKVFAEENGIEAAVINKKLHGEDNIENAIIECLEKWETELVVLAGYMKKIGDPIIEKYKNRILNIHPALLPSFGGKGMYGMHVHEAVLESGVKFSGVTVHIVDNEYDSGSIVMQEVVPVFDTDTPEELQKRILKEEYIIYTEAIKLFADDRIKINGRKVIVKGENAEN